MLRTASVLLMMSVLAAGVLAAGCGSPPPAPAPPVPAGWQTVGAPGFTFQAPPEVQPVPVQGIDSIVGKYASPTLEVLFDLGQYANPLTGEGFVLQALTVDGRPARLATKDNWSAIHFPGDDGKVKLTMSVRRNGERRDGEENVEETILRSIDFP